jgi:recombination protein RecA
MAPKKKAPEEIEDTGNPLDQYTEIDNLLRQKLGAQNYHGVGTGVDLQVDLIPTGLPTADYVMGGIPLGYMITLEGPSSSGKNTFGYYLCGVIQQALGKPILWVDAERRFETSWPTTCGMSCAPGMLALATPPVGDTSKAEVHGAQGAMTILREGVACGLFGAVVLDSIGALIMKEQYESDIEGTGVGRMMAKALLLSQTLPQIASLGRTTNTTIILINQLRAANIGGYGAKTAPTGGAAVIYQPSLRLNMARVETIEGKGGEAIGITTRLKAVKNTVSYPFREGELRINFTKGVDVLMDIIQHGIRLDLINKKGSWISYEDIKVQGEDNFQIAIEGQPAMLSKLKQEVMEKIKHG